MESRPEDEIEQVKRAMPRLLIRLDTPLQMTPESWAEGMVHVAKTDPMRLRELTGSLIYHDRRNQVVDSLGRDHPLLVRSSEVEEAVTDEESELAEALEAYTDRRTPSTTRNSTGRSVRSGRTGSLKTNHIEAGLVVEEPPMVPRRVCSNRNSNGFDKRLQPTQPP
jgi:hypothetical protein